MLKKIILAAAIAVTPFTLMSQAQAARSIEGVYTQCGIGGLIFGDLSKPLAVISNVIWDLGTTAALSDSLSPETCRSVQFKTAVFIQESMPSLEKDLASGRGEHLQALNSLMSCPVASKAIRRDYGVFAASKQYNSANMNQKAEQLFQIVNNNMEQAGCNSAA